MDRQSTEEFRRFSQQLTVLELEMQRYDRILNELANISKVIENSEEAVGWDIVNVN